MGELLKMEHHRPGKDHSLILVILDNAKLGRVAFGFEGALGLAESVSLQY